MRYAASKGDHQFRIADDDLKKFVGVLLLSGYHKVPQISLNWDTNIDMSVGIVRNAISKNRFKEIKKYFHCADNDNLDLEDKFSKVRPLFDIMNSKLNQFGYMHNKFSIDEQMVPYTGMHSGKQTIRIKSVGLRHRMDTDITVFHMLEQRVLQVPMAKI